MAGELMLILPPWYKKKRSGGYYVEILPNGKKVYHKNGLTALGAGWFLRTVFRGEAVLPATYYLGLSSVTGTFDGVTLTALAAGEPVGNGYARQALVKNTVDWTVQEVNGAIQALSKAVIFTATGNWTANWQYMFLCDAAAGGAGNVVSLSGPAPSPRTVLTGQGPTVRYEYWLRG